jgi:hypothetical protein
MQSQLMKLLWKLKLIRQRLEFLLLVSAKIVMQCVQLRILILLSSGHGIIEEIYVADGDTVKAGQQLFKMKITGEAPAAGKSAEAPKPAAAAPPPPPKAPEAPKAAAPVS